MKHRCIYYIDMSCNHVEMIIMIMSYNDEDPTEIIQDNLEINGYTLFKYNVDDTQEVYKIQSNGTKHPTEKNEYYIISGNYGKCSDTDILNKLIQFKNTSKGGKKSRRRRRKPKSQKRRKHTKKT